MKRIAVMLALISVMVFTGIFVQAEDMDPGYFFGAYSSNGTAAIDLGYSFKGKVLFEYDLHVPKNITAANNAIVFGGDGLGGGWGTVGAAMYINNTWSGSEDVFYTQDATGNGQGNVINSNLTWKEADETPAKKGYTTYHVEVIIDTTAKIQNGYGKYEIYITPEGGEKTLVTLNGYHGFRTSYEEITKFGVWSNSGTAVKISNLSAKWLEGNTKSVTVDYVADGQKIESHLFLRGAGETFICPAKKTIEQGEKEYYLVSRLNDRKIENLSEDVHVTLYYESVKGNSIEGDYNIQTAVEITGTKAHVTFKLLSEKNADEKLRAIAAVYKKDGTIGDVGVKELKFTKEDNFETANFLLDAKEGDKVGVFIWNNLTPVIYQKITDVKYEEAENTFNHPGLMHTKEDLERIAIAVKEGEQPYLDGWNALKAHWLSKPTDASLAQESIDRTSGSGSFMLLGRDISRAYQCALRWHIEGDEECAQTAVMLLNDWADKLKEITGNDRFLVAGIYGYQLANAAELMRDYPGFDTEKMQTMLTEVFVPLIEDFLTNHNGAYITEYWANWDLANIAALMSIGVFCDRYDLYEKAIEYYRYGDGNGSIYNAIPHLFENGLAQTQESGRDQGHNTLCIGYFGVICETAWNQGDDLYSWANNRLMYAAEYVARYNNGHDVPFELYEWGGYKGGYQSHSVISQSGRGAIRPIWELLYNHYAQRLGYEVPNIKEAAERVRPEGSADGNFDLGGFGTLLYTKGKGIGTMAVPLEGNIEEGTYRIIVKRTGKALTYDIDGVTQKETGKDGQIWEISDLGSGQYLVKNKDSGLYLSTENGSYDPKANITVGEYTGADSQKFAFLPTGEDGYYRITPVHTSKALDVLDNSNNDGARIIQWRYLYNANQQWRLEKVEEE